MATNPSAPLRDGWNRTKNWAVAHKDLLYEAGAIGLTILAGAACGCPGADAVERRCAASLLITTTGHTRRSE
ncbi:hypothetical protein GCM10010172_87610 [Paractinoplanes ferrugineus]|uniref:Uncharacterized protein n=1 Tax=Paractinoplanes ferrugineus TaxID=113564 RepID=A0A919JG18_9ACTN|nr:hypothetical protein [Actinoplanes ferrugineus]GIE16536.1 hypothetical protein Afe05nite_83760 [Actinoplanes ferrugineus]